MSPVGMCDSRYEILRILKRERCTVDDLSSKIGISPTAVRQHLTILEGESLVQREMLKEGIGVSKMYPLALDQIPSLVPYSAGERNRFPHARFVASHILTIPTHPYLKKSDKERIISSIKKLMKDHEKISS